MLQFLTVRSPNIDNNTYLLTCQQLSVNYLTRTPPNGYRQLRYCELVVPFYAYNIQSLLFRRASFTTFRQVSAVEILAHFTLSTLPTQFATQIRCTPLLRRHPSKSARTYRVRLVHSGFHICACPRASATNHAQPLPSNQRETARTQSSSSS